MTAFPLQKPARQPAEASFDPDAAPAPMSRAASHSLAARLQGAAMILILLLGMGEGLAALTCTSGRHRLADNASFAAFFSGKLAGAVNYVMAHDLPSDAWLRAGGGIFRWRLFDAGGPQVSPGCGNWLFLTEELRPWPDADRAMEARADAMRRIADRLEQRNVAVLFALVPDKARVEAAELCGVRRPAQELARYDAFLGLVQARRLPVVDLRHSFAATPDAGSLFYHTDTHWSLLGAADAADAIAHAVPTGLIAADHAWRTDTAAQPTQRPGDLLRLMSLEHVPDFDLLRLRPLPDTEYQQTTRLVSAPAESGDLLGAAPALPVILLGSSFSLNGHFYDHLQQALSTSIGQFAEAGGAFSGAARTYFANAAWRDTPPRLIIWEIPERVVGQPATPDEQAFLDGTDPSGIARK